MSYEVNGTRRNIEGAWGRKFMGKRMQVQLLSIAMESDSRKHTMSEESNGWPSDFSVSLILLFPRSCCAINSKLSQMKQEQLCAFVYKLRAVALNWQLFTLNTCSPPYGNTEVPGGTLVSRISRKALKMFPEILETFNHTRVYNVHKSCNKTSTCQQISSIKKS